MVYYLLPRGGVRFPLPRKNAVLPLPVLAGRTERRRRYSASTRWGSPRRQDLYPHPASEWLARPLIVALRAKIFIAPYAPHSVVLEPRPCVGAFLARTTRGKNRRGADEGKNQSASLYTKWPIPFPADSVHTEIIWSMIRPSQWPIRE